MPSHVDKSQKLAATAALSALFLFGLPRAMAAREIVGPQGQDGRAACAEGLGEFVSPAPLPSRWLLHRLERRSHLVAALGWQPRPKPWLSHQITNSPTAPA
jgi:hypothetical protein